MARGGGGHAPCATPALTGTLAARTGMTGRPTFAFDGREVPFREGQSVAAALTGAGIRAFRRNEAGNSRGLFCGIGVCQDCVVEIDGAANQRACVARAAVGMRVRTQVPRPVPPEPIPCDVRSSEPQRRRVDVVIVGGGAGGLSAAIAAARCGADVLVLDERSVAGGQYFKQTAPGLAAPPLDAQQRRGAALVEEALRSGVQILPGAMVWSVFAGFVVHAEVNGGSLRVEARAMVVATGAYERPLQVPGWDLPGVMTTGAAQTLWRSYRTLPGRRIAIAGSGPLNLQVALELRRGGAEIRLLAESAPPPWLRGPILGERSSRRAAASRAGRRHAGQIQRSPQQSRLWRATCCGGAARRRTRRRCPRSPRRSEANPSGRRLRERRIPAAE